MPLSRRSFVATVSASITALLLSPSASAFDWGWGKSVSGSGTVKSETRAVSGFTTISLELSAKLTLVQGNSEGLTLETDDNLLPLIETLVENGHLHIRAREKGTNLKASKLNLTVNLKTLEKLSVSGSGDVRADTLKAKNLTISVAGSADVRLPALEADSLKVSISGSGDLNAAGKVGTLEASIAGSGDIKAAKLQANDVKISIAGSGKGVFWAKDNLKVSVAGSGDVQYWGDPKTSTSVAGSGSIKRLGANPT